MSKRSLLGPKTPTPTKRLRSGRLIQGSPQIVASDHPVEDAVDEVIEEVEEIAEAMDIADGDAAAAAVDHVVEDEMEYDINSRRLHRFAHLRGRHFLPLQPGILTC